MKLLLILLLATSTFAQAVVSAPIIDVAPLSTFTVPIDLDEASGIFAYQFHMSYNRKVMEPLGQNYGCSTEGTIAQGYSVDCNAVDGVLRVSVYGAFPLEGDGTVLNITFRAKNKPGCSELELSDIQLYNIQGYVKSVGEAGMICVVR